MRDIIFRGKCNPASPWIYGNFARLWIYNQLVVFINGQVVQESSIGQFTGMLDKNGVRIFEGDIVRAMMDWGPAGMCESVVDIGFKNSEGGYRWNYFDVSTIEVIGNIYDNPELLDNVPQEKVAEEYHENHD